MIVQKWQLLAIDHLADFYTFEKIARRGAFASNASPS